MMAAARERCAQLRGHLRPSGGRGREATLIAGRKRQHDIRADGIKLAHWRALGDDARCDIAASS